MMGNDISNASPSLVMVHADVFAPMQTEEERKFLGLVRRERYERKVNIRTANAIYRNSLSFRGVTLECFSAAEGRDLEELEKVEEYLETKGINPFRTFTLYSTVREVVDQMAYLPRLLGVVDVDERAMRYGSKFLPLSRLTVPGYGG